MIRKITVLIAVVLMMFSCEPPNRDDVKRAKYTVTFKSNSGSEVLSQTVTKGKTVEKPANPGRDGYDFKGWYKGSDLSEEWDFTKDTVTKNVELLAKWEAINYSVSYNLNEGNDDHNNPTAYTIETAEITLGTPTKTGYSFAGWYNNSDLTGTAVTTISQGSTGIKEFWAKWTLNDYTVTFNSDGGSDVSGLGVNHGGTITLPSAPTKTGYTFGGWFTEKNGAGTEFTAATVVTASVTVFAKWTPTSYNITYNLNSGNNDHGSPATYTIETAEITLGIPTRTGYTFDGWYSEALCISTAVTTIPLGSTGAKDFWAKWGYLVTFNSNDGSAVTSAVVANGSKVTEPSDPTKSGFEFIGWYKESGLTTQWNFAVDTVTAATTLYAKWLENYAITYNLNSGNDDHGSPTTYTIETTEITLGTPTRANYTFDGWYADAGFTGSAVTTIPAGSTGAKEFWAKWTGNTFSVTLEKQSGTGGDNSVTATYGSAMPAGTAPTREEFVFQGYYDATSGGTKYYNADMSSARSWDKAANTTLYARWVTSAVYNLRDTGPAGGLIFYINPNAATDGWKYLEAAPQSTEWTSKQWGKYGTSVTGTGTAIGTAIGTGKNNTALILAVLNAPTAESDRAAQLCDGLSSGGFNDWFLPSKDELNEMYVNLKSQSVGGFADDDFYWSSSEYNSLNAWIQNFYNGNQYYYYKYDTFRVRAVRAF